eukprot:757079-Hanusia_phi.AAC.1
MFGLERARCEQQCERLHVCTPPQKRLISYCCGSKPCRTKLKSKRLVLLPQPSDSQNSGVNITTLRIVAIRLTGETSRTITWTYPTSAPQSRRSRREDLRAHAVIDGGWQGMREDGRG